MSEADKSMGVYVKRKAEKIRGKFDKKTSIVIRPKMLIANQYAEKENEKFDSCGIFYVLNMELTEKYNSKKKNV